MAPKRVTKKQSNASTASSDVPIPAFPAPPTLFVPTKSGKTPSRTPQHGSWKASTLLHVQKEAIIENLQLELAERARRLRAQYALQAQGLRNRLEIRIHRIPAAYRKQKLGDLLERHEQQLRTDTVNPPHASKAASPVRMLPSPAKAAPSPPKSRAALRPGAPKRKSDEMHDADKENATAAASNKRVKANDNSRPAAASRTASRRVPPSQVLSPKSNNSRTLQHSPFKPPMSPVKSGIARPTSPLKSLPAVVGASTASSAARIAEKPKTKTAAARTASRQLATTAPAAASRSKRAPEAGTVSGRETRSSNASVATSSSTGTTVVTKVKKAPAAKSGKTAVSKLASAASKGKAAVTKKAGEKVAAGGTSKAGRTLRKRT